MCAWQAVGQTVISVCALFSLTALTRSWCIPFSPNFFIYSSLPPSNIGNGLLCASSISRVTSRRDLDFIFYDALDFPKLST